MYARGDLTVEIDSRRTAVLRISFKCAPFGWDLPYHCDRYSSQSSNRNENFRRRRGGSGQSRAGKALRYYGQQRDRCRPGSCVYRSRDLLFHRLSLKRSLRTRSCANADGKLCAANPAIRPDTLISRQRGRIRYAIDMLNQQEKTVESGLENQAGMIKTNRREDICAIRQV